MPPPWTKDQVFVLIACTPACKAFDKPIITVPLPAINEANEIFGMSYQSLKTERKGKPEGEIQKMKKKAKEEDFLSPFNALSYLLLYFMAVVSRALSS